MLQFLRNTHVDGIPRKLSEDVQKWLRESTAGFLIHMLKPNGWMNLDDVVSAVAKYAVDNHEEPVPASDVAYFLIRLAEHGLIKVKKNTIKIVEGDLVKMAKEGKFDVIIHGCNCFCTMGSGIAKQIKHDFPEAYESDKATVKGDRGKLGTASVALVDCDGLILHVVNGYTQYNYGTGKIQVDYDAVRSCLKWVKEAFVGDRIGLPKIGAGLAGGDWDKISQIIGEELNGEDVTLVMYNG